MSVTSQILQRLKEIRINAGVSEEQLEEQLILGRGWVARFESGETVPNLDLLLAMLHLLGSSATELFDRLEFATSPAEIERHIYAQTDGSDLLIHFQYSNHNAVYRLQNATEIQFELVIKELRNRLQRLADADTPNSESIKKDAVARTFLLAVQTFPHTNPSDLWTFLVYRAYCDPFNHPAKFARLDFSQSWRRTGGWALEEILVRHYAGFLQSQGINIFIATGERKATLMAQLITRVGHRLEADKVDIFLSSIQGRDLFWGCSCKS